jgi:hypothetical protein
MQAGAAKHGAVFIKGIMPKNSDRLNILSYTVLLANISDMI